MAGKRASGRGRYSRRTHFRTISLRQGFYEWITALILGGMEVYRTQSFERDFIVLPTVIQKQFERKLVFFVSNPFHPSLRVKKMAGADNIWEARITKGHRFTFTLQDQVCILRRIGTHNILRRP